MALPRNPNLRRKHYPTPLEDDSHAAHQPALSATSFLTLSRRWTAVPADSYQAWRSRPVDHVLSKPRERPECFLVAWAAGVAEAEGDVLGAGDVDPLVHRVSDLLG